MKQGLSLRTSQHLALTPQLQQSIRLLQLSTLELSQEVEQMLDDNPFLERDTESAPREEFGLTQADTPARDDDYIAPVSVAETSSESSAEDGYESSALEDLGSSWEGDGSVDMAPDDSEWGGDAPARGAGDEVADASEWARSQESLAAHLQRQASGLRLNPIESHTLHFLIESLNDDGYLEDSLDDLALGLVAQGNPSLRDVAQLSTEQLEQLEALTDHFRVSLGLLQSLDPVGVGARHLGECLALQIKALQAQHMASEAAYPSVLLSLALHIVQQPMDVLARRDIKKLMQITHAPEAQVREALALVARLEPKPGRRFVDVSRQVVVPDVLVRAVGTGANLRFRVSLNPDVMPKLRVHDIYANALRGYKSGGSDAGVAALQQRLQEARWFIKNIQQRFDTIVRVSEAIVERQKNFFSHGELAMRPLVLREIADALGLHESTISRVTTAKYMATPFGTFELKYFFGSGLGTDSGANASSTAVRALIKQFVAAENLKKPLSDNQIAEMLKEQGIDCARRTVAKYREALKIAPANLRKTL